jgi:hypothetical protein
MPNATRGEVWLVDPGFPQRTGNYRGEHPFGEAGALLHDICRTELSAPCRVHLRC